MRLALNPSGSIEEALRDVDRKVKAHYATQETQNDLDLFDQAYYGIKKKKDQIIQNPIGGIFGYNYIGPGTKFNAQTPINKLDQIGRLHDMDYRFAHREQNKEKRDKNLIQADRNMINRMNKIPLNEQNNFYHFVKHAMKMKILATEAGILPADLFVNKGEKVKLAYLLPPKTVHESNKTNIISKFINNKLGQRRTKEAQNFVYKTPEKKKNDDTDDEKFDTPYTSNKTDLQNLLINKTSNETSSLLEQHYNNLNTHKQNVDNAISSNDKADIIKELGSPEHYPAILSDAYQKNGNDGVVNLAQHYSNNLSDAIADLEHTMSSSGITALSQNEVNTINPSDTFLKENFTVIPSTANKKLSAIFSPRKTRKGASINYNPPKQYYKPS